MLSKGYLDSHGLDLKKFVIMLQAGEGRRDITKEGKNEFIKLTIVIF